MLVKDGDGFVVKVAQSPLTIAKRRSFDNCICLGVSPAPLRDSRKRERKNLISQFMRSFVVVISLKFFFGRGAFSGLYFFFFLSFCCFHQRIGADS